jgi:hypothetical protein
VDIVWSLMISINCDVYCGKIRVNKLFTTLLTLFTTASYISVFCSRSGCSTIYVRPPSREVMKEQTRSRRGTDHLPGRRRCSGRRARRRRTARRRASSTPRRRRTPIAGTPPWRPRARRATASPSAVSWCAAGTRAGRCWT